MTLPLFMPIYAMLLVLYVPNTIDYSSQYFSLYHYDPRLKTSLLIIFIMFSAVLPGISYAIMSRFNMISSIEMKSQAERRGPIFLMLLYCVALYAMLFFQTQNGLYISKFVLSLPLSGAAVAGTIWIINNTTKVSLHGSGAGILSGFIVAYGLYQVDFPVWQYYFVFLLSGLVLTTRLYLYAHTPAQVYIGYLVGFALTFIINFFYPGAS